MKLIFRAQIIKFIVMSFRVWSTETRATILAAVSSTNLPQRAIKYANMSVLILNRQLRSGKLIDNVSNLRKIETVSRISLLLLWRYFYNSKYLSRDSNCLALTTGREYLSGLYYKMEVILLHCPSFRHVTTDKTRQPTPQLYHIHSNIDAI